MVQRGPLWVRPAAEGLRGTESWGQVRKWSRARDPGGYGQQWVLPGLQLPGNSVICPCLVLNVQLW